ncbi:uncharacterized protein K460DRAFT_334625 [Cucurbitaria berberidis CBS 394.84]|uniref:Mtf2-like C-terminal domain-containing protein n=1 Tax=Cucurbitaria berberidis CBS 394.84 TaxID=1168544 RepID=A0A9P4LBM0_9PLEO|nr:uncharacterized protein K460DRAFT_334625 [Cucurbitaria berberidis CBS 394.84]KAF1848482.1 hypothetical protein K460DRAFT_334625 [Cucurbitaria berberidis CBS 394.84]
MSICSSTIRAISRSRIQSKTLLPFLYQTTTIQQWRPLARRNIASRSNNGDDIPFEDESLPPAIDQPEPARKTTITGSERAAFEKLYRTFNTEGRPKNDKEHVVELDQIADEYYEDEEEGPSQSLDKVFDEVFKGQPRLRGSRNSHVRPKLEKTKLGQEVQASTEDASSKRTSKAQDKEDAKAEVARLRELKLTERARIDKLLKDSQTDRELWQILKREVLSQVRKLNLDGTIKGKETQGSKNGGTSDLRILFQNYPHHLITAVQTLRKTFPSSPLPLSILPTIKSLGRSAYALGATTTLYKHLLRTAWLQQSSYTYIDTLLVDMDNGAIEFDSDILTLLDSVIKEHEMARGGRLGREMQMVYGMEQFLGGIRKLQQWRDVVADRLGVAPEERRVPQQRIVRKVDYENKGVDAERFRRPGPNSGITDGSLATNRVQEDIPLVEGLDDADQGAQESQVEHVHTQELRDAELLIQDMGLADAKQGRINEPLHKHHQHTEKDTRDTDKAAKIFL